MSVANVVTRPSARSRLLTVGVEPATSASTAAPIISRVRVEKPTLAAFCIGGMPAVRT